MLDLSNLSSSEIDIKLDALELKLFQEQNSLSTIEDELTAKRKEMVILRNTITDLEQAVRKGSSVISQTKMDIRRAERKMFKKIREEKFQI